MPPSRCASVYTVDAAVEGVHFTRDLLSLDAAAARAVSAAVSDLAAMGASTDHGGLLCSLTLPPALADDDLDALLSGVARASLRYRLPVLGGNLSRGPCITITTTVIGSLAGPPVTRHGARPGDLVVITGAPGLAALGLRLKQQRLPARSRAARLAAAAFDDPRAQLDLGASLAPIASAMIDVSDGVAADAGHIARASCIAMHIDADALHSALAPPLRDKLETLARDLGASLVDLALRGGEDYLLLATVPPTRSRLARLPSAAVVIGRCAEGAGVFLRASAHDPHPRPVEGGFDHFVTAKATARPRARSSPRTS